MAGLELVTRKRTDTRHLRGLKIITRLSNQMIRWLLKSFCFCVDSFYILPSCDTRVCSRYFCRAVIFQYALLFRTAAASCDLCTRDVTACLSSELLCSAEVKSRSLGETFLAMWRIDVAGLRGPRGQIQAASHTNCLCGRLHLICSDDLREHQESNLLASKRFSFSTPLPPFNNPICL